MHINVQYFSRKKCVQTWRCKTILLWFRLSLPLIKLKCACHFFTDYDDVFSNFASLCVIPQHFVIDTTPVPVDQISFIWFDHLCVSVCECLCVCVCLLSSLRTKRQFYFPLVLSLSVLTRQAHTHTHTYIHTNTSNQINDIWSTGTGVVSMTKCCGMTHKLTKWLNMST